MKKAQSPVTEPCSLLDRFREFLSIRPFHPPVWLRGGHLQTIAASLHERRYPWGWKSLQEEYLDLSDGSRVKVECVWKSPSEPTLVAVHGMGGSSGSSYMRGLSHKAFREGWNAVLLNLYNCNGGLRRPKVFHAGSSPETGEIVNQLSRRHHLREIFLVGVSMGGNIVLKLLGEWSAAIPGNLRAAAVISPLVDLTISWQILERASNFLYQRHFVSKFKAAIHRHESRLSPFVDVQALLKIRTIREFDELFTVPLGGFRDAFHYYEQASALPHVRNIRLPTLIIHSQDDPLLPWGPLVTPEVKSNPRLLVCLTRRGGHTAFLERNRSRDIDRFWAENRVIDFLRLSKNLEDSEL